MNANEHRLTIAGNRVVIYYADGSSIRLYGNTWIKGEFKRLYVKAEIFGADGNKEKDYDCGFFAIRDPRNSALDEFIDWPYNHLADDLKPHYPAIIGALK